MASTSTPDVPAPARDLARRHASLLGVRLPGAVVGVYLVGSAVLGDFRTGRSDVDTVTLTSRNLGAPDEAALVAVHAELAAGAAPDDPAYDTTYVPATGSVALRPSAPSHRSAWTACCTSASPRTRSSRRRGASWATPSG